MSNNKFEKRFGKAIKILMSLEKAGYEAYFVGGCVRDYLLNSDFSDIDITTNALPDEVKSIFRKTIDTGLEHGTVTVLLEGEAYEITTFRTESEYSNHRSPDKVEFVSNLKEDLDRRDFSINAMALNSKGELYDFHNGRAALEEGIIATVNDPNERFYEDALRMLRAFRFSSKLNFEIEEKTLEAIKNNAKLIEYVSIERIVTEFRKLLAGVGSQKALEQLLESGIQQYIPVLKSVEKYRDFSSFTFCQSLYIIIYFNNIEFSDLKQLKLSNKELKQIKTYIKVKKEFDEQVPIEIILYNYKKEDVIFVSELFGYLNVEIIVQKKNIINSFNEVKITSKEIIELIEKKPGPWIKEVTKKLENGILLGEIENKKEKIIDFLEKVRDNI